MLTVKVRNVNEALRWGVHQFARYDDSRLIKRDGRPNMAGTTTYEFHEPVATTYLRPRERVLFCPIRNANPFFHFFEALWMLAGRNDVEWLSYFLDGIKKVSDDGKTFNGAYGHRLRHWSKQYAVTENDQIKWVVSHLVENPNSRRAILSIYDPKIDYWNSKDIPCNATLAFSIVNGELRLTVFCRSNDMVWGAYGANVVQFSTIQEVIAQCLGVPVGSYTQISNNFHVYEGEPTWERLRKRYATLQGYDPYRSDVAPYRILKDRLYGKGIEALARFDADLQVFMRYTGEAMKSGSLIMRDPTFYFGNVAYPLFCAYMDYKRNDISQAIYCAGQCEAQDWRMAAVAWLSRTKEARATRAAEDQGG